MTRKLPFDSPEFPHGERRGYARGCKCAPCRAANSADRTRLRRDRAQRQAPENVPHGYSRYINWSCRCEVCKTANLQRIAEDSERRKGRTDTPHGTTTAYRFWRCRCDLCCAANRTARLALTQRHQEETKPRARRHYAQWTGPELELLSRSDLSTRDIARLIGRSYYAVETKRRDLGKEPALDLVAGVSRAGHPARLASGETT
jgi:hypothetical protein